MLSAVDVGGGVLALLIPAYIVLRFSRWWLTLSLGTLSFWLITVIQGFLLESLDPERDGALLDGLWFFIGWIAGFIYSGLLYGLRYVFLFALARLRLRRKIAGS